MHLKIVLGVIPFVRSDQSVFKQDCRLRLVPSQPTQALSSIESVISMGRWKHKLNFDSRICSDFTYSESICKEFAFQAYWNSITWRLLIWGKENRVRNRKLYVRNCQFNYIFYNRQVWGDCHWKSLRSQKDNTSAYSLLFVLKLLIRYLRTHVLSRKPFLFGPLYDFNHNLVRN